MRCLECGEESTEATQVCARCGAPIAQQRSVVAGPAAGVPGDPIAPLAGDVPLQPVGQRTGPGSRLDTLMAGVGLVALAAVIVVIAIASSLTSPAPSTLLLTYDQLQPGDCLQGSDLSLGTDDPWPYLVTAVPCTQRHIAEVFFAGDIWPQSLAYPGDDAIGNQADARCGVAFTAYDGISPDSSVFDYRK